MHTQGCKLDSDSDCMGGHVKKIVQAVTGWWSPSVEAGTRASLSAVVPSDELAGPSTSSGSSSALYQLLGMALSNTMMLLEKLARQCFAKIDCIDSESEHALVQWFHGFIDCPLLLAGFSVSG
jgi:hypothetical protein